MKFRAEINVMPLEALLDPQGRAVQASLQKIGLEGIGTTRVGKRITLEVEASSEKA
ncbi:MAG: phosphoribosylformylglycinamidine synthase subunit PurS, partial [Bacteroidales bacterium]|nr:phosphoribosylformylglycinamidine synthase subunit PurS [Bacteroidales bacterium]